MSAIAGNNRDTGRRSAFASRDATRPDGEMFAATAHSTLNHTYGPAAGGPSTVARNGPMAAAIAVADMGEIRTTKSALDLRRGVRFS